MLQGFQEAIFPHIIHYFLFVIPAQAGIGNDRVRNDRVRNDRVRSCNRNNGGRVMEEEGQVLQYNKRYSRIFGVNL